MPEVPEACSPTRTFMPTITSRLLSATAAASHRIHQAHLRTLADHHALREAEDPGE